ncbi:MAG: hypothetical protein ABIU06_18720 [Anaerolineales bacterium]
MLTLEMGNPAQAWKIPLPQHFPLTIIARVGQMRYGQALDVYLRSMDMVSRAVTEYRLEADKPDVIIRPQLSEIDTLDVVDVHEVIRRGEDAFDVALPKLKSLFKWQRRWRRRIGL